MKAALDEVRNAKVSFGIASMLTRNVVGPGPLPSSSLVFKQDLSDEGEISEIDWKNRLVDHVSINHVLEILVW